MNGKIITAGRIAILAVGIAALGQTMHFSYGVVATMQAPVEMEIEHKVAPEAIAIATAEAESDVLVIAAKSE